MYCTAGITQDVLIMVSCFNGQRMFYCGNSLADFWYPKRYFILVEDEPEIIELVPNIILNPGFDGPRHLQDITPDENSNNETLLPLNNNTVVQPEDL